MFYGRAKQDITLFPISIYYEEVSVGDQKDTPEEMMPIPKVLMRIYYIFPIIIYVPDMIFNFYVYIRGTGIDLNNLNALEIPGLILWGLVSAGLVGMAWLLSVLAPWHGARKHYFQSAMCWFGVLIATSITIWNSLSYRTSENNGFLFPTDHWFSSAFGVNVSQVSPTTVLVAIAPPFWGLFWAIVQPAERKRNRTAEEEDHQARLDRLRQEAEIKQLKAQTTAQIRAAQIKGLAATINAARGQITSGSDQAASGHVVIEAAPARVLTDYRAQTPMIAAAAATPALPAPVDVDGTSDADTVNVAPKPMSLAEQLRAQRQKRLTS